MAIRALRRQPFKDRIQMTGLTSDAPVSASEGERRFTVIEIAIHRDRSAVYRLSLSWLKGGSTKDSPNQDQGADRRSQQRARSRENYTSSFDEAQPHRLAPTHFLLRISVAARNAWFEVSVRCIGYPAFSRLKS
jgi:hypothetical protein